MRAARFLVTMAGLVFLVACGDPGGDAVRATETPTTTTTVVVGAEPLDTYTYELTATSVGFDSILELHARGAVDRDVGRAEQRFGAEGLAMLAGVTTPPPAGDILLVQDATSMYVLGVSPAVIGDEAHPDVDPGTWYEGVHFDLGGADAFFLDATQTAEKLWGLVGALPDSTASAIEDGSLFERTATLGADDYTPHFGSNTVLDMIGRGTDSAVMTTREDSAGLLVLIELALESDGRSSHLRIEIGGRGQPVDIATPVDPQPWPEPVETEPPENPFDEARREAMDELRSRIIHPDRDPMEGVVLRLSIPGGWQLPDTGTQHLSFEADGRVVRVADTSVFSSTTDYTSLTLSPEAFTRLFDMIEESGISTAPHGMLDGGAGVSPTDRSALLEIMGLSPISMDRIGATDGYSEAQIEWRAKFDEVIAQLVDLSWLGEDILEREKAWVPDSMTVLAGDISPRSGLAPSAPFAPWPLPDSVEAMASGTALNPYDEEELVICLTDDDVAPVFALLTGVNHAYLRVDDGTQWELNVRPHYPGYRLVTDPCP